MARRGRGLARALAVGCLAGLALLAATASPAIVRGQDTNVIIEIRTEGASQVEQGQVLSGLRSRVGEELNLQDVTTDVKNIFDLGFFRDVRAEVEEVPGEGIILIFQLVEKPRIAYVRIVGSTRITESELKKKIKLQVGNLYSQRAVDDDLAVIRQEYRGKGYFKLKTSSRVERLSETSFGLTYIVEEAPRLYITNIRTHNTTIFTDLELRRAMQSAAVDCFSWITESGVFDENKINADMQGIAAKYLALGYIRLLIDKPKIVLFHNREFSRAEVDLTFHEGQQYFTGSVDIAGDILGKKDELMELLGLRPGDPYNPFAQNRDRFRLNEVYQEQGYAFARVEPDVKYDDENRLVDVVYRISKGDKAYIGRIEFKGNRETRDYVMRREFEVRENELYNGVKLRNSQANLTRLGYFSPGLNLKQEPTQISNVLDIITEVEESQTGTLQAQMGYSSQSGVVLSLSISKGNLFGRGQTIRFSTTVGQRNIRRAFQFDFIEPHLFDSDISSDSSISYTTQEDLSELNRGDINETQLSQGFGIPILPLLRLSATYDVIRRDYHGPLVEPRNLRSITPSLRYNSVNHPIFPSTGTDIIFAIRQVGGKVLGGDTEYRRYRLRTRKFVSLNDTNTLILLTKVRLSWLEQIGDHLIPLEDRFRLGGIATVRGYELGQIGGPFGNLERLINSVRVQAYDDAGDPIFDTSGNPVTVNVDQRTLGLSETQRRQLRSGGTSERLLNVELLTPLAGDNVRGVVFYDAGNVNAESRQYDLLDEPEPAFFDLKQSVGFGVRVISPIGVFRFEYGRKLQTEEGESPDKFDFTVSSLF